MGNFQGGGNRGGGGGFRGGQGGGRPSFQKRSFGGDRQQTTMHKAVCDECNKSCEVPFRPSGDKPVYCSDCFSGKRDDGERAPRRDFNEPKNNFNSKPAQSFTKPEGQDEIKKQLNEINSKIANLTLIVENFVNKAVTSKVAEKKTEIKKVIPVSKPVKSVKKAPVKKVLAKSKK